MNPSTKEAAIQALAKNDVEGFAALVLPKEASWRQVQSFKDAAGALRKAAVFAIDYENGLPPPALMFRDAAELAFKSCLPLVRALGGEV